MHNTTAYLTGMYCVSLFSSCLVSSCLVLSPCLSCLALDYYRHLLLFCIIALSLCLSRSCTNYLHRPDFPFYGEVRMLKPTSKC
ncbi:hypothetical protein V8F20_002619 [Naviculisporaceae sp. PSN 640]